MVIGNTLGVFGEVGNGLKVIGILKRTPAFTGRRLRRMDTTNGRMTITGTTKAGIIN